MRAASTWSIHAAVSAGANLSALDVSGGDDAANADYRSDGQCGVGAGRDGPGLVELGPGCHIQVKPFVLHTD